MIKPLNNNVVLEPVQLEKKTASGILLAAAKNELTQNEGIVVAVGPGIYTTNATRLDMSVSVGERVIYAGLNPRKIQYQGKEYIIVPETDILAVV